jgi:uncharacterized integral membrane protein
VTNVQGAPQGVPKKNSVRAAIRKRETRDNVRIVAAVIIVAILIAFVIANSGPVSVHFVFFVSSVRLIWVLVVTALLGGVADRLLMIRKAKIRREEAKKARS